jgi:hypothetical protein
LRGGNSNWKSETRARIFNRASHGSGRLQKRQAGQAGASHRSGDALQAALQKIDLQRLLTDLAFQLGDPDIRPTLLPVTRKRVAWPLPELTPPPVQHVRVHFTIRANCQPAATHFDGNMRTNSPTIRFASMSTS